MNIQENWEKAVKFTEIIRPRVQPLSTNSDTAIPYIFLAKSLINEGDTVVRSGEVLVEKPLIALFSGSPQFEGFDFEKEADFNKDIFMNFLIVRGIKFPSMKYNNITHSLSVYEGKLESAIKYHLDKLERMEDVHTGLLTAPADSWQFATLIFICNQVIKSADNDIKNFKNHTDLT